MTEHAGQINSPSSVVIRACTNYAETRLKRSTRAPAAFLLFLIVPTSARLHSITMVLTGAPITPVLQVRVYLPTYLYNQYTGRPYRMWS